MARTFRRRIARRGRRGRRTPWYNKKYSTAQIARAAWRSAKYIRTLVNSEVFKHDVTGSDAINNTWHIYPLTNIAMTSSYSTRTGNSILVKSLMRRIRVSRSSDAASTTVRMVLLQDKQQISDTSPAAADVFEVPADIDTLLHRNNVGRFTILADKTVVLTADTPVYHAEKYRRIQQHVRYNGAAATDIQKNGLYFLIMSDQSANTPTFDHYFRVSFHDN